MAEHRIHVPELCSLVPDGPPPGKRRSAPAVVRGRHHESVPAAPAAPAADASAAAVPLIEIDGPEATHALRVKRIRPGEAVVLFDGCGHRVQAVVADPGEANDRHTGSHHRRQGRERSLVVQPVTSLTTTPAPHPRIAIAAAVAKGGRPDDMVDSLSQAGVDVWIPLVTARSVVDPREGKIDKWQRRAVEAAKQCGRDHLLDIRPPTRLADLIHQTQTAESASVLMVADQQGVPVTQAWAACCSQTGEADVSTPAAAGVDEVMAIIGPEGGLNDDERALILATSGSRAISLGPWIMRIETAAVAAGVLLVNARDAARTESRPGEPRCNQDRF